MIKQSFTWWSFENKGLTADELLKSTAEIGYSEDLFPLTKKYGLALSAHRGHLSIPKGLNRHEHHQGILKELEQNIKTAEAWNIPTLICFSGNREGLSNDEGAEMTAEGLR